MGICPISKTFEERWRFLCLPWPISLLSYALSEDFLFVLFPSIRWEFLLFRFLSAVPCPTQPIHEEMAPFPWEPCGYQGAASVPPFKLSLLQAQWAHSQLLVLDSVLHLPFLVPLCWTGSSLSSLLLGIQNCAPQFRHSLPPQLWLWIK